MNAVKVAKKSELPRRLNALLDLVRKGESVLIVDNDQPIARLEPIAPARNQEDEERLARLEKAGLLKRGRGGPSKRILTELPVEPSKPVDIVAELIKEREEGW